MSSVRHGLDTSIPITLEPDETWRNTPFKLKLKLKQTFFYWNNFYFQMLKGC